MSGAGGAARPAYLVGIDLGTSNTALAFAAPGSREVELFAIEQLVAPGQVAARPLLPSVRYHPAAGELDPAALTLPWPASPDGAVLGAWARDLGGEVPGRVVASAKSWLSHAGVDRTAPILPWGAEAGVARVSPVEASASYLAHLRAAWDQRFPAAPLAEQALTLTVPASFDEGARALTLEAARRAGLGTPRLLEEPQAAVYDWLFLHRGELGQALAGARLLLVCDVGGGTTDLTLIQVSGPVEHPEFTRIGVGDHLMLGGDNMDLALAHLLEARLAPEGRLGAARFAHLVARARAAKETLLAPEAPEAVTVTLLGGGSKLVGGSRSASLTRDEARSAVLDGYFPGVALDAPLAARRGGLVEFGLPYPADPAITRHLAAFLRRHAQAARLALGDAAPVDGLPLPDAVLLNGGVFHAEPLVRRLVATLETWRGGPLRVLHNPHPDWAVARGAVAYGLAARGEGPRIGGGSARSYFLVLEGEEGPGRGLCLLPRGAEPGQEIALPGHRFELRLGRPVRFPLACSSGDSTYEPGELVVLEGDDFLRLPPVATVVPAGAAAGARAAQVRLSTTMTEIGTLAVDCVREEGPPERWRLDFELRAPDEGSAAIEAVGAGLPPRFDEAVGRIDQVFGESSAPDGKAVRRLRADLETLLGRRANWDLALLRALCDALLARARRRRRSVEHERLWLNLTGYCLRPGVGDPLDAWRIEQLTALADQGLAYEGESQNWSEWWTLWRRVAGGLDDAFQARLLADLKPWTLAGGRAKGRLATVIAGSRDDMWRLLAALEGLPAEDKRALGAWFLATLRGGDALGWWALGRLGARQLLQASAHHVLPPDVVTPWLAALLALDWKAVPTAPFAAVQIARLTGDRARDLGAPLREQVAARLVAAKADPRWVAQTREVVAVDQAEAQRAFGESLPAGLRLLTPAEG